METFDIQDVEIFAAGTWNGDSYSTNDLDEMVRAFREIGDKLKPYLKLGHGDKQKILEADSLPAAGWIKDVRRMGNKLVADFTKVPKKIYELIKTGAYRRVSSEIYWNITIEGKKYPYALKAVAMLGGATPAVESLADIMALYGGGEPTVAYETQAEARAYSFKAPGATQMTEQEIKALSDRLSALEAKYGEASEKVKTLEADKAALADENKGLKSRAEKAETESKNHSLKASEVEVKAKIDELVAKKKIVPAQKEKLFALLMAGKTSSLKTYGKEADQKPLAEALLEFIAEGAEVAMHTDEESEVGEGEEGASDTREFTGADVDAKIQKYMKENPKVSYKEAMVAVSKEAAA